MIHTVVTQHCQCQHRYVHGNRLLSKAAFLFYFFKPFSYYSTSQQQFIKDDFNYFLTNITS